MGANIHFYGPLFLDLHVQLPKELIQSLTGVAGFEKEAFENAHNTGEPITSVRMNPMKSSIVNRESSMTSESEIDIFSNFNSSDFLTHDSRLTIHDSRLTIHSPVPWCKYGYYLSERPVFTLDPTFHSGAYYVQESSSMFLDYLLRQILKGSDSLNILDLCAAPGGKTTLVASLPFFSLIVANEIIKTRVSILYENVVKWGNPRILVTNNDPKDFGKLPGFFDVLVIDAPCSGSGLFRKDPEAINEWSGKNVEHCSERQQRILADAFPALKENGWLIYSTCSYSVRENEAILDWLCESFNLEKERIEYPPEWGITETQSDRHHAWGYRFYPNKVNGEGFFIACMQKRNAEDRIPSRRKPVDRVKKEEKEVLMKWVHNKDLLEFVKVKDQFFALPGNLMDDYLKLETILSVRKTGTRVGNIIRGELIPDHELALSTIIAADLPFTDLHTDQALQYLRKQRFSMDSTELGWVLARYIGLNLGWMKVMPNRINNHYPSSWRILKL